MTTLVLVNLGNGPVTGDVCLDHAIAAVAAFIEELKLSDPPVAVTLQSPKHDGTGRYRFDLHRGIRTVDVDMPGVPLSELRYYEGGTMPHGCPRLYVEGNSWWWCYALETAKSALEDYDGSVEQRVKASEQAAEAELDRQPRCGVCGSVRSLVTTGELYEVCCYTCNPEIHTHRETPGGAVYADDGWKRSTHYIVGRQHMPPEVPGHENPMHPDALCGAMLGSRGQCRLRRRHEGRCEGYWKEIERTLVMPERRISPAFSSN